MTYWGLRAYGTNPQIWGGDDDCEHEWGVGIRSHTCIHCGAWRGELGSEPSPELFISHLCDIFDEVRRVLRKDGVCWVNMGDSYNGYPGNVTKGKGLSAKNQHARIKRETGYGLAAPSIKPKDLCLMPDRLALELQARGWWIRSKFTWWKGSAMPESTKDRPANSHEWVIMLTRSKSYWYDIDAERIALADSTLPREMRGVSAGGKWVNGPDGQTKHTMGQPRRNLKYAQTNYGDDGTSFQGHSGDYTADGRRISNPAGRNLRTGDFMQMSLDAEIEHARNYLASLHEIKRKGGMIHDDEGMPVGLFCNPKGFKDLHFASFPPRFVEILLNLSVPAKCCAVCGKGWKRVTKRPTLKAGVDAKLINRKKGVQGFAAATSSTSIMRVSGSMWKQWKEKNPDKQLGFRPDCSHYDDDYMRDFPKAKNPRKRYQRDISGNWLRRARQMPGKSSWVTASGIVLDPFLGVATTAMVAERLSRRWIGIELSAEYVEMARKRMEQESPLFALPTVPPAF